MQYKMIVGSHIESVERELNSFTAAHPNFRLVALTFASGVGFVATVGEQITAPEPCAAPIPAAKLPSGGTYRL
ncbi:MAG: hypothetical protein ACRD3E_11570 [Terriglobales bacterium]